MKNLHFSLIIPVFNTARFLPDCLNSCLNQAPYILNKDYEIICINDGSTDDSTFVLKEYEAQGIKVITQVNAGVSSARNNGLMHAEGEYIWFIDSDDYIKNNILSSIYQTILDQGTIGLRVESLTINDNTQYINDKKNTTSLHIVPTYHTASVAWNYIVSSSYLKKNKIKFDTSMAYGEDTLWVFWINFFHGHFTYCIDKLYFYRQRVGSAMHSKSEDRHLKHLNSMMAMLQTYQNALTHYGNSLSVVEQNHLQHRIYWSVQNILFDAIRIDKRSRHELLNNLIREGLYPYPILWGHLSFKYGINNLLINIFCLLFPYKLYYQLVSDLLGSKK